jgi:hypothetical protein
MKNVEPMELLSAFLDGEEVRPAALADALSTDGAREALRDWTLLRADLRDDEEIPGAETYRQIQATLRADERGAWWRRVVPIPAPALAASVLVALALAFWTGLALRPGIPAPDEPPVTTHVVRFEPGVDWHEIEEEALRP